jgi:hypothetical protein
MIPRDGAFSQEFYAIVLRSIPRSFSTAPYQGCQMVIFSYQNFLFGYIFDGLTMENVGLFYGHLVYFTVIWSILQPFGILHI